MNRLGRFEDYRYIGTRDSMRVYDCDDDAQFASLTDRIASDDLVNRTLVKTFAPDTIDEARNRGFKPV